MKHIIYTLILLNLLASCVERVGDFTMDQQEISTGLNDFDFSTTTEEKIELTLKTNTNDPMTGVLVNFWSQNPNEGGEIILKLITNDQGHAVSMYQLNSSLEVIYVEINTIGLPKWTKVTRDQLTDGLLFQGFSHDYQELNIGQSQLSTKADKSNTATTARSAQASIQALGTYNSYGVPDYLETSDVISVKLLEFINASLPESKPVPTYHPAFLSDKSQTNLDIQETADVWLTFVHEGAGYKNTLGFYQYPTSTPPQSVSDIAEITIAFPNVSYQNSGGGLKSGNKVHLGRFESGTSIGFVLFANGWNGDITTGIRQVYSHEYLNPETDPTLQAHNVLLWDATNELFLLGFEDLNRMEGSDDDFNDAIFYLTSNPVEAISIENVNPIDEPLDSDNDGVNDTYDEFPTDNRYAYQYSYPSENSYGSFAFEDNWPGFGDYDFNDLVVDYKYTQIANAKNQMVKLNPEFIVQAVGAGFNNAFGVELDIDPSQIASVSGYQLETELFDISANGTESNQSKAVIIATDEVHRNFGTRGFVNTDPYMSVHNPDTIQLSIAFNSPIDLSAVGSAPFNPFIVINQIRGREAHLPGYEPTDLVDTSLFGTGNDASDPANNVYYKSQSGYPWVMSLPVSFDYPNEKTGIQQAYNHFGQWAKSSGFSYMDWYQSNTGYRNPDKIYKK